MDIAVSLGTALVIIFAILAGFSFGYVLGKYYPKNKKEEQPEKKGD